MSESIRYSFSNRIAPDWDFPTLIAKAREHGYEGIALTASADATESSVSNVFLTDCVKLRKQFGDGGVKIVSLASRIALTGSRSQDLALTDQARRLLDCAADAGAESVRVLDPIGHFGKSRADLIEKTAAWIAPLAEQAAHLGVALLIQNTNSLVRAQDLWLLVDYLSHPSVGVAWDQLSSYPESQSVSLPTLNQRCRLVIARDATVEKGKVEWRNLGDGVLQVQSAALRLKGLGYRGFISVEYPKSEDPDARLKDSISKLREWTKPPVSTAKPKPAPKPAGAAAAPPKPAAAAKPAASQPSADTNVATETK